MALKDRFCMLFLKCTCPTGGNLVIRPDNGLERKKYCTSYLGRMLGIDKDS